MQEPTAFADVHLGDRQTSSNKDISSKLVAFGVFLLVVGLVAGSIYWLQWAAHLGITLGYSLSPAQITSPSSSSLVIGENNQFSASATGRELTFAWNFGDQGQAYGPTVSHIYQSIGSFTVTVTVTDGAGHTSAQSADFTVAPHPPSAYFTFSLGYYGYVYFDASGSTADPNTSIANYIWNFGDGNTDPNGSSQETHAYTSTGSYQVTLFVTDATGQQSDPYTAVVVVS